MPGARVFALIDHSTEAPSTAFLEETVSVTPDLLEMAAPLLPTQVFRFSAPCVKQHCVHWEGTCTLVERITKLLPVTSLTLPPCQIRATCRWFSQQGREACRRCPQVVTHSTHPSELMTLAATPHESRGSMTRQLVPSTDDDPSTAL